MELEKVDDTGTFKLAVLVASILVAVVGASCTAASGGDEASIGIPTATPTIGRATPTPVTPIQHQTPIQHRWIGVPLGAVVDHETIRSVVASTSGRVAVGDPATDLECARGYCDIPKQRCPIWYSSDGRRWDHVSERGCGGAGYLGKVIVGGPGYIAMGADRHDLPGIWTSSDGRRWTRSGLPLPPGSRGSGVDGIVRTAGGFLAFAGVAGLTDGYVWTSTDARSWAPVADESGLGGPGEQRLFSVVRGPSGLLGIGGQRPSGSLKGYRAMVWTSPDGSTWARHIPRGIGNPELWSMRIVSSNGRFVGRLRGHSWASADGIHWAPKPPGQVRSTHRKLRVHVTLVTQRVVSSTPDMLIVQAPVGMARWRMSGCRGLVGGPLGSVKLSGSLLSVPCGARAPLSSSVRRLTVSGTHYGVIFGRIFGPRGSYVEVEFVNGTKTKVWPHYGLWMLVFRADPQSFDSYSAIKWMDGVSPGGKAW